MTPSVRTSAPDARPAVTRPEDAAARLLQALAPSLSASSAFAAADDAMTQARLAAERAALQALATTWATAENMARALRTTRIAAEIGLLVPATIGTPEAARVELLLAAFDRAYRWDDGPDVAAIAAAAASGGALNVLRAAVAGALERALAEVTLSAAPEA